MLVHAIQQPRPGLVAGLVLRPPANHAVPGLVMLLQVERQVGLDVSRRRRLQRSNNDIDPRMSAPKDVDPQGWMSAAEATSTLPELASSAGRLQCEQG